MTIPNVLAHNRRDNVGVVVVENLAAGDPVVGVYTEDDSEFSLNAVDAAPLGHKIALSDLQCGDIVYKYGENIGKMSAAAKKGEHVHVHNLKTNRW